MNLTSNLIEGLQRIRRITINGQTITGNDLLMAAVRLGNTVDGSGTVAVRWHQYRLSCLDRLIAQFSCWLHGRYAIPILDERRWTPQGVAAIRDISHADIRSAVSTGHLNLAEAHDELEYLKVADKATESICTLYTSGSTGSPKPIEIPLVSIIANAYSSLKIFRLQETDTLFINTDPRYTSALCHFLYCVLSASDFVLYSEPKPANLGKLIEESEANIFGGSPAQIHWLLKHPAINSLEAIFISGDYISPSLVDDLASRISDRCIVYNCLGFSEIGGRCFIKKWTRSKPSYSIGFPIAGITLDRAAVDESDVERVKVSSSFLAQKYTEQNNPVVKNGFYSSGDLIRRGEHGYHFIGREGDFFKISGNYVSGLEIRAKLLTAYSQLEFCVYERFFNVQSDQISVLLYSLKTKQELDELEIIKTIKKEFGKACIPRDILKLDKPFFLNNGKIDKGKIDSLVYEKLGYRRVMAKIQD